ncbi:MAG: hypothetical protein H8M99_09640 [Gloeobacteraceae cyanobacterium ES-bin-144]|nr:hypothetical protein [Verrucomicrobiales bacterium]
MPSILAVESAQSGKLCLAVGDARRGSYWTSRVENFGLASEPELCDVAELEAVIKSAEGVSLFSFEDPARFQLQAEFAARIKLEFPNAARLWQAWQRACEVSRHKWAIDPPQPIYLKPPHITPTKRGSLIKP